MFAGDLARLQNLWTNIHRNIRPRLAFSSRSEEGPPPPYSEDGTHPLDVFGQNERARAVQTPSPVPFVYNRTNRLVYLGMPEIADDQVPYPVPLQWRWGWGIWSYFSGASAGTAQRYGGSVRRLPTLRGGSVVALAVGSHTVLNIRVATLHYYHRMKLRHRYTLVTWVCYGPEGTGRIDSVTLDEPHPISGAFRLKTTTVPPAPFQWFRVELEIETPNNHQLYPSEEISLRFHGSNCTAYIGDSVLEEDGPLAD